MLCPPVVPFYRFWGEGSPTIYYRKKKKTSWYPVSNLSTGGPSMDLFNVLRYFQIPWL